MICRSRLRSAAGVDRRALRGRSWQRSGALGALARQQAAGDRRRLDRPRRQLDLVAVEDDDTIVAVGSVTDAGEITMNYVAPHARFRGVSRALLAALEARAIARGNTLCQLHSTETAHRFYLANGYVDTSEAIRKFGMNSGYPMSKRFV